MEVSSYGGATTESSGLVRILKDLSSPIAGKDVLIVEDIIDTGLTLNYLLRYLRGKNPAQPAHLHAARQARAATGRDSRSTTLGFTIPDEFVVGYGLDFGEFYRNLPFIGVLRRELYDNT